MTTQHALTLSQAIEGRLLAANAKGLSENTIKEYTAYYRKLQQFYAATPDLPDDLLFVEIDVEQLQHFMLTQEHLSKKSRSNIRVFLSSMWAWSTSYHLTSYNVAGELETIKPESRAVHPFTHEDVKSMLNCVDRSKPYTRPGKRECTHAVLQALRNKAIIYLLLDTGLRNSELASLLIRDIDKRNMRLKVMRKGTKERIVPFSSSTSLAIWHYLASRPDARPEDPVFITTHDRPLDKYELYDVICGIGKRVSVANVHPHRFRHSFGRSFGRLVNASMDATREQTRVFSPWRLRMPRRSELVSVQGT